MIPSSQTGKLRHGAAQRLQGTAGRGAGTQTQVSGSGAALRLRQRGWCAPSSSVLVTATRVAVPQASPGAALPPGTPCVQGHHLLLGFILTAHSVRPLSAHYVWVHSCAGFSTTWRAGPPFSGGVTEVQSWKVTRLGPELTQSLT